MKIYTQTFDLAKPVSKMFSVAQNSEFGIGIKIVKDGAEVEDAFEVQANGETLTPEADKISGFTVYLLNAGESDVVYTVTCNGQTFKLTQNTTPASVFDFKPAEVPQTKYGASLDVWLGDVDENGVLQSPTLSAFEFNTDKIRAFTVEGGAPIKSFASKVNRVNLPNLLSVGNYSMWQAFKGSTVLSSVNLPALTTVGEGGMLYAFQNCTGLKTVNFPALTTVGTQAFQTALNGCTSLQAVNLSSLSSVTGALAFNDMCKGCTSLTSINLDNLVVAGGMLTMLSGCTSLEYVSMPNLTSMTTTGAGDEGCQAMFKGCTGLKTVDMPKWSHDTPLAVDGLFYGCTSLQVVNISEATAIPNGANVGSMFYNTNDTYKVIVPDALYEDWIVATGWSNISAHIAKASDYAAIITNYNGADSMDD